MMHLVLKFGNLVIPYFCLRVSVKYNLIFLFVSSDNFVPVLDFLIFSPLTWITGPSIQKFRESFLQDYSFETGFIMDSSNFADVSSWALSFSIFKNQK